MENPDYDDGFVRLRERSRARLNLTPIVAGQAISLLGDYIAYFTIPLFVVALTGSAADLGMAAAFETLPMLLMGFIAGVFIDRRARLLPVLIAADLIRAAAFIILAMGAAAGVAQPWMVFGVAFVFGSMSVVFDAGLQALMPAVLEEDMLVEANTRLQFARTMAMTIGPAIGGLVVSQFGGFATAFSLDAATFVASAAFLATVRVIHPRAKVAMPATGAAIREGLSFLFRDARLRWATLGATLINLVFAPLEALLVLYVTERVPPIEVEGPLAFLFQGQGYIGLFFAGQALIGALGVIFASRVARAISLGRMFVLGLVMLGGGFLMVAFMSTFWAVIPSGVALAGVSWSNVALATLRQRVTPTDLLGRVITASRTLAWAGLPLGAAVGGFLGEQVGLGPVYTVGSLAVLGFAVSLALTALWRDPLPPAATDISPAGAPMPPVPTAPPERDTTSHGRKAEPAGTAGTTSTSAVTRPSNAAADPWDHEHEAALPPGTTPDEADGGAGAVPWRAILAIAGALGSMFVLIAEALEAMHPGAVAWTAALTGATALGLWPGTRRLRSPNGLISTIALGVIWIGLPLTAAAYAQQTVPSAIVGALFATLPVAAAVAALRRAIDVLIVSWLVLGGAGVLFIVAEGLAPGRRDLGGIALALGGVALFGVGAAQLARKPTIGILSSALVAAVATTPLGVAGWSRSQVDTSSLAAAIGAGALFAVAGATLARTLPRLGPLRGASPAYLIPVVAIALGVALRSEPATPATLIGVALLIIAGAALVWRAERPSDKVPIGAAGRDGDGAVAVAADREAARATETPVGRG